MVTLHHFTTPPLEVAARGGWEESETAAAVRGPASGQRTRLAPVLRRVCTLNKPNIVAVAGYLAGTFPPGRRDVEARRRGQRHPGGGAPAGGRRGPAGAPGVPVGLALAMSAYEPLDGGEAKLAQIQHWMEDEFLAATEAAASSGSRPTAAPASAPRARAPDPGARLVETMGYEFWPRALEATVRRRGRSPAVACRSWSPRTGCSTADGDATRIEYVSEALAGLARCLGNGIGVLGYTYWTLLDKLREVGPRLPAPASASPPSAPPPSSRPSSRVASGTQVVRANGPMSPPRTGDPGSSGVGAERPAASS